MPLVQVTAADYDSYLLDFEIVPRALEAGQPGRVRFFVRQPGSGAIVRRFEVVHERIFHLFVLSHDLEYFAHIHPVLQLDGTLEVALLVPRPGPYQMVADFMPLGAPPQLVQRSFVTAGYAGSLIAPATGLRLDSQDKVVDETRVKLTMPDAFAGREQLVTFDLNDVATGSPVTDLEPYLGASGHLLLVSADLAEAHHSHPVAEISKASGPTVVFQVMFPSTGAYRMWAQFQRGGKVLTASFTVPVGASLAARQ